MKNPLSIALLTDIHAGADKGTKIGSRAPALLDQAIEAINGLNVDLVVEMGDRINNATAAEERHYLEKTAVQLRGLSAPVVHLMGNHDIVNLDPSESAGALGKPMDSRSLDLEGWHLVFWQANVALTRRGFEIAERDLDWLSHDLSDCVLPTVVFSHIPFSDASMQGNYYFERYPAGAGGYRNASQARDLLAECPTAVLAVAGHVHWNSWHCIDGIHHLTAQSLTETFTTYPEPAGAWVLITLSEEAIKFEAFGREPTTLTLPLRPPGQRWMPAKEPVFPD